MAMNPSIQTGGKDRRLYIWFAVFMPIIVLIKNRRLHPAFLWGTLFVIAFQPLRLMLAGTDVWLRFVTALVGLMK